jgi:hypothetical protein
MFNQSNREPSVLHIDSISYLVLGISDRPEVVMNESLEEPADANLIEMPNTAEPEGDKNSQVHVLKSFSIERNTSMVGPCSWGCVGND